MTDRLHNPRYALNDYLEDLVGLSSGSKISSMRRLKSRAILNASGRLGSYLPLSSALTVDERRRARRPSLPETIPSPLAVQPGSFSLEPTPRTHDTDRYQTDGRRSSSGGSSLELMSPAARALT